MPKTPPAHVDRPRGDAAESTESEPTGTQPARFEPAGFETAGFATSRRRMPWTRPVIAAVVAFAAAAGVGALLAANGSTAWQSSAVLTVDQPLVVAASRDAGPIEKLSRLRLQYAALLGTAALAEPIAERVGQSPAQVAAALTVSTPPTSLLVVITASADSSRAAQSLAGAAADELSRYARRSQAAAGVPTTDLITIQTVTPAQDALRVGRDSRTIVTASLLLGAVAAAVAFLGVSQLRRPSRR